MAINPNHADFSQMAYNSDEPIWFWKDNTVYKRMGIWSRPAKDWFKLHGFNLDCDNHLY